MKFLNEQSYDPIPIYRVIDNKGQVIDRTEEPRIDNETLLNMYKTMVQLNQMDEILIESQQQGRISMYLTNYGEEGIQVGSGAALLPRDMIFAQYRELGVLLYRGMTVTEIINQCYGNHEDRDKGRQIPMHFGNKEKNIVTASSPLATQMPQAVGAAYAFKRAPNNERCVICYFGDGAASEGDAHAAFNFAATLQCPVILFCRNNGYAVWTPTNQQYRGDGIAARGLALGLHTIRVDGTDALAVYRAVERAREIAIQNKPVLIEAMSYRVGLHSTADFSNNAFRSVEEIQKWAQEENPVEKLRLYLEGRGLWNSDIEKQFLKEARDIVLRTIQEADQKKKAHWKEMLQDVYYVMPQHLQKQMNQMEKHLEKYKEHYPLDQFQSE
ncbi:2-oxoisovalerate dehydrogenase subunit alpha, mitochondrial-like [Bicyclus anynana]|uniref:2-oxoisovalerate dehydrogenase subunit alpha n=1 Tax=Bicyclus anynana TaxID=110368 RepID=A0ABM3LPG8_BICAN|nr:2-oxoisovalerate dehydrogenase subunit alpha, mitochondrial-like [Bicyclus anynana]